jgi:hypothetical protein
VRLIWGNDAGAIDNGTAIWSISAAPTLSFSFDGLFYCTDKNSYLKRIGAGQCGLSEAEKSEIATYISAATPISPTPLTKEQVVAQLEASVQAYIDSVANRKGYESAERCISYLNSTNDTWKSDATAMNSWRDQVWMYCQNEENTANTAPTADELIAALPAAPW